MSWFTKILKRPNEKGQYHGTLRDDKFWEDGLSAFDKDEIDHAISLSLIEQDRKGKKFIEEDQDDGNSEDDEMYVRAHSEELVKEEQAQLEENRRLMRLKMEEAERQAKLEEEKRRAKLEEEKRRAKLEEEKKRAILEEEKRRAKLEEEEKLVRAQLENEEQQKNVRAQLDEDEQLAKALQDSLNAAPPRQDSRNVLPPFSSFFQGYRVCAGCHSEIGHGRYLSCMNAVWHPECFRCHACNLPIIDHEFSISGGRPYHKSCYKEQHHPKCDVCSTFIPTNIAGLIEYRAHPFWLQKYCPSHERDGTPRCCSCERMEPRDMRYLSLEDGRKLCLECLDSAIMDTHECQPLYFEIREFYEGLNMKVDQEIPMLLVERPALNEAMEGEKNGHHHMPETRGLCLSEEQTITTVARRPRVGAGYRLIDMITEPHRLIRTCEVTAILILYGLPRLLTGSILAHEMMHSWLRLKGYPHLAPEVEEGICQVLAHMWLESETYSSTNEPSSSASSSSSAPPSSSKKGKKSDLEKKLGDFFKHQIEADTSPAYGDGFRMGNRAVHKYGLKSTLDHIRLTGTFPV